MKAGIGYCLAILPWVAALGIGGGVFYLAFWGPVPLFPDVSLPHNGLLRLGLALFALVWGTALLAASYAVGWVAAWPLRRLAFALIPE
jgi:hypothetical protein